MGIHSIMPICMGLLDMKEFWNSYSSALWASFKVWLVCFLGAVAVPGKLEFELLFSYLLILLFCCIVCMMIQGDDAQG